MKELLTIEPVTIYEALQGRYIRFVSDLDNLQRWQRPGLRRPVLPITDRLLQ